MFFDFLRNKACEVMKTKAILLFILPAFLLSCLQPTKQTIPEPIVVETATVAVESVVTRQSFISSLSPNYIAVVQPRVAGYLSAKLFQNGMPVKMGQTIFKIDNRRQRADMLAAKASLESAKAQAIEAANNYNRAVPLAAIDAISQAQLDQYTAQYKAAKESVKSAEQNLRNAELDVEYTTIKATINGIISSSEAYVGDYVGPGTKFETLTKIENIDTLCAEVAIPVSQYLALSGRKAFTYNNKELLSDIELYLADGTKYPLGGSYSYTKSAVASTEGTIILVVTFPNPDYLLKSGQFARVKTNIGAVQPQIIIPDSAINEIQGVNSVWVVDRDSTVHYRQVTVGDAINGSHRVVLVGLKAGEKVVLDGGAKLSNGQKVKLL